MTCRLCGRGTDHHPACLLAPREVVAAYSAINSLGAVVPLERLTSGEYEDAEHAAYISRRLLPYDPDTSRVLHGMYRGMAIQDAEEMEVGYLRRTHTYVGIRTVTVRPWWRWFCPTLAVELTPTNVLEVLL
ncbi:hypothetical protein Dcar01_02361 [Deinococcus carri]|uniref:Uncharacterized protein n=1 Tax=Deinococcus carri TaxID=1211323 RepID=A0ABP9W8E9_9DEIO